jgi:hypothetical protein
VAFIQEMSMADLKAFAEKGNGILVKRGTVWTYPGAEFDTSGTNLRLPTEYVSDADVQAALQDGSFMAAVTDPYGSVTSVRVAAEGVVAVTAGLAGTAEMGTELPVNSRVESDAGAGTVTQAQIEAQTVAGLPGEGSEIPGRDPAEDPRRRDGDKGPFGKEVEQDRAGARKGR